MAKKKNKILIVEDSRINQEVLFRILKHDHTLLLAKTGPEALEIAKREHPDIILLDIILPEMDGFEVLTRLKKNESTHSIPVLIISGMAKPDDEVKGLTLGAVDYITKPFHDIVVKTRIDTQLRILKQMRMIEEIGFIDTLTNIPNRRQFDKFLVREWNRAIREKTPVSILMIDVDHFKIYNDTFGHPQGDVALQMVADAIVSSFKRSVDIAARWGGEEFAVLLVSTLPGGTMKVAEAIRQNVEATKIPSADGTTQHSVTISIGVAHMIPTNEDSISDLVRKADEALYKAKDRGRNQVCSFEEVSQAE